jgi:hypothetical protein
MIDFKSLYVYSASKGIEEKDYEFKLDFYSEVVPEVCFILLFPFDPLPHPSCLPYTGILKKALDAVPLSHPPQKRAEARILVSSDERKNQNDVCED